MTLTVTVPSPAVTLTPACPPRWPHERDHAPTARPVRTFAQRLSATRRGTRLARLLATEQLRTWEMSPTVIERAEQIVAELSTNAVQQSG